MNTTTLMDISRSIAAYPYIELVLAVIIVGWIAASLLLRRGEKGQ